MAERNFEEWLSTFVKSINGYDYYVDFSNVYRNTGLFEDDLNKMNSLVGSKNIEAEFKQLISSEPNVLLVIPALLAIRETKIYCQDENGGKYYDFAKPNVTPDEYCYFMRETGLFDLLENHIETNLFDYLLGVNAGLDSNGRKNRGGHQMENLVEHYIQETGLPYVKEMYLDDVEIMFNIDLSSISAGGTSTKRFDFVVKGNPCVYLIETNFYTSSGSKLNETARSYKMISEEVQGRTDVKFIWLTDGAGWISARNNLHETFNVLPSMYNIADLENGILKEILK